MLFHLSTCAVSPESFPTAVCCSGGITNWEASQKSVKQWACRNASGIFSHNAPTSYPRPVADDAQRQLGEFGGTGQSKWERLLAFLRTNDHHSSSSKIGSPSRKTSVSANSGSTSFFPEPIANGVRVPRQKSALSRANWSVLDKLAESAHVLPPNNHSIADYHGSSFRSHYINSVVCRCWFCRYGQDFRFDNDNILIWP